MLPNARIGQRIGERYRLTQLIGIGGTSAVYMAEDERLPGKRRAVKAVERDSFVADYREEARMLMRLNHPQLPDIFDVFADPDTGTGYIVMEYVEGRTLEQWLGALKPDAAEREAIAAAVARQAAELLHYLHTLPEGPVIYRDMKPSNLMVDLHGRLCLIDFGIARVRREGEPIGPPVGTRGFAAPEQYRAGKLDERSDLYNLGAVLFHALSGGEYPTPERLRACAWSQGLSDGLAGMIIRLLDADPERRYRSAAELLSELDRFGVTGKARLRDPGERPKLLVIGGVASGAGSTFAAVTIARTVAAMGSSCKLYELRNGNRTLANETSWIRERGDRDSMQVYPQCGSDLFRSMHASGESVRIADVSGEWEHDDVKRLLVQADEIVFVADCNPARFYSPEAAKRFEIARVLRDQGGRRVSLAANRMPESRGSAAWLRAFPWMPSLTLPLLSYESYCRSLAERRWPQDGKAGSRLRAETKRWLQGTALLREQTSATKKWLRTGSDSGIL